MAQAGFERTKRACQQVWRAVRRIYAIVHVDGSTVIAAPADAGGVVEALPLSLTIERGPRAGKLFHGGVRSGDLVGRIAERTPKLPLRHRDPKRVGGFHP